jgi:peptidyl-prolyl cis-trans isomerase C
MGRRIVLMVIIATLSCHKPAAAPGADTVVARIRNRDISAGDVRQILEEEGPEFRRAYGTDPVAALGEYFTLQHLARQGEGAGLEAQSPWKEQLRKLALDRKRILANAVINRQHSAYKPTDTDVQSFYERNKPKFEQLKITTISIAFPIHGKVAKTSDDVVLTRAERETIERQERLETRGRRLADDISRKARGGADFGGLAARYSNDSDLKVSVNTLAVNNTNQYPANLKAAIFSLKPGEISDPIGEPSRYYVIRCDERSIQSLAEVHDGIVESLRREYVDKFMKDLNRQFSPTIQRQDFFTQQISPPVGGREGRGLVPPRH